MTKIFLGKRLIFNNPKNLTLRELSAQLDRLASVYYSTNLHAWVDGQRYAPAAEANSHRGVDYATR
jgi:hypothetical protein